MIFFSSLAIENLSRLSRSLEGFVLHFLFFLLIVFVTATMIILLYLFLSNFKEIISVIKDVGKDVDIGINKPVDHSRQEKKIKNLPVLKKKYPGVETSKIDENLHFIDEKGEIPVKSKDEVMEGWLIMREEIEDRYEKVIPDIQDKKAEKQYEEAVDEALDLAKYISKKYMEFAASRKDDLDE